MRIAGIFLLFTYCVQIFSVTAAQEVAAGSGALSGVPGTESGSIAGEFSTDSGSLLSPELLPGPPVRSSLRLCISELLWMGSDLSTADEWIELMALPVMTGGVLTEPQSFDGWTLSVVKDGQEAVIARLNAQHGIGSGGFLLIANNHAAASRLRVEAAIVSASVSLPNTKLLLRLRSPDGTLIDEADDGVGTPFAGANPSGSIKASMERADCGRPGVMASSWRTATTQNGWDTGTTTLGTPGYTNGSIQLIDLTPPLDATGLRAYLVSGSLLVSWVPSVSDDVIHQTLSVEGESFVLPATSTGMVLPGSSAVALLLRQTDASGLMSSGSVIQVQPLLKPIISEVMSDPAGSDDGEWIELVNHHDAPLTLAGWKLKSGSSIRPLIMSGSILEPGEHRQILMKSLGLTLPNAGSALELSFFGKTVDRFSSAALPEGVSAGRGSDGAASTYCRPTPGEVNTILPTDVRIDGVVPEGRSPHTVNLQAVAVAGTLEGAACRWEFSDGYTSESCNPPAHAIHPIGSVTVRLEVTDYCGNTVVQHALMNVLQKPNTVQHVRDEDPVPRCADASYSGVMITELLPHPAVAAEEWVELTNTSSGPVTLCGWSLDDMPGGSKSYALPDKRLLPGDSLIIHRTESGIAFNDDQDSVRLIAPVPGGGTGVLMSVPYERAPEAESYAWRVDRWLWTRYRTPGSPNMFQELDLTLGASPIVLHAAMPNPEGRDTWGEWVELRNTSKTRPVWLNGWVLRTASGKTLSLQGIVLAKREVMRLPLERTPFTLLNRSEALQLIDPDGNIRSVLAWEDPASGKKIRSFMPSAVLSSEDKEVGVDSLLGVDVPSSAIFTESYNMFSALTEGKKLELQKYSSEQAGYLFAEGADVAKMLLQSGLAVVTGRYDFSRRLEFLAYERDARKNALGIWAQSDPAVIDEWRMRQQMDARVRDEGFRITVHPASGVIASGTVVTVKSSVPAQLFMRSGTGHAIPFSGSLVLQHDAQLSFAGVYDFQTQSGVTARSSVVLRSYNILRSFYKACLRINEVYPSPGKHEYEWVELYNRCDEEVNIAGWQVDDEPEKGSKPHGMDALRIPAHGYSVISGADLGITLNNTQDAVRLQAPNGQIIDSMWYPSIKKEHSYAWKGGGYCLTAKPTPGAENICMALQKAKKAKKPSKTAKKAGLKTVYSSLSEFFDGNDSFSLTAGLNVNSKIAKNSTFLGQFVMAALLIVLIALLATWVVLRNRQ